MTEKKKPPAPRGRPPNALGQQILRELRSVRRGIDRLSSQRDDDDDDGDDDEDAEETAPRKKKTKSAPSSEDEEDFLPE